MPGGHLFCDSRGEAMSIVLAARGSSNGASSPFHTRSLWGMVFRRKRLMLVSFCGLLAGRCLRFSLAFTLRSTIEYPGERVDPAISQSRDPTTSNSLTRHYQMARFLRLN